MSDRCGGCKWLKGHVYFYCPVAEEIRGDEDRACPSHEPNRADRVVRAMDPRTAGAKRKEHP